MIDLRVLEEKVRPSYADFIALLNREFNNFMSRKRIMRGHLLSAFRNVSGIEISGVKLYFKWKGNGQVRFLDLF